MKSSPAFLALALPVALAACNQGPSVSLKNATGEEVAAATKATGLDRIALRHGEWKTKIEVLTVEAEGMPPEAVEMMKRQSATTVTSCMSKEQAEKPGPETFSQKNDRDCNFREFRMDGGSIDATMVCKAAGGEMVMTMKGSYTAESMDYSADMDMGMPGGRSMKIKTKVTGHRTGDCTPDKKG